MRTRRQFFDTNQPSLPATGSLLGRYRLGPLIARGGMAEVFLTRDANGTHTEARVVKRMHSHLASNPRFVAMFVDEARVCSRLEHPNIVRLHDFEATDQGIYLILEYVDGCDLREILKVCATSGLRIPARLAVFTVAHVLEALDFASSRGVVHRDVSPSNILVSRRGRVKLTDFGIASAADRTLDRTANMIIGKFGYMSPEQARGLPLDARSDQFSAAVVLAELLMCRRLFRASSDADVLRMVREVDLSNFSRHGGHIPNDLRAIVKRALRSQRSERFENAAAFRDALAEWLASSCLRTGSHELAGFVRELAPMKPSKSIERL